MIDYDYLIYALIIEFSLILIVILLTFGFRIYISMHRRYLLRLSEELLNFFTAAAVNNRLSIEEMKSRWKRLDLLVPYMLQIFQENRFQLSLEIKAVLVQEVVRQVMLPMARKWASKRNIVKRLWAAKCFCLMVDPKDEDTVIELLNDTVAVIKLEMILGVMNIPTNKVINTFIDNAAAERKKSRNLYLAVIDPAKIEVKKIITKRLAIELDPYVKATCYECLLLFNKVELPENIVTDMQSSNVELAIDALRFFVHVKQQSAIEFLRQYLQQSRWEVTVVAIQLLVSLGAVIAIPDLALLLNHPERWVRLNAAKALKDFGGMGIEYLKKLSMSDNKCVAETAKHVLDYVQ